ncbi:hypothetical protein, partial [Vreelandella aquamarina]|uniref:hypothetical protein n=1 Tax=Vreelandella aquamarina TaxID=77097 RepID=UPI001CC40562
LLKRCVILAASAHNELPDQVLLMNSDKCTFTLKKEKRPFFFFKGEKKRVFITAYSSRSLTMYIMLTISNDDMKTVRCFYLLISICNCFVIRLKRIRQSLSLRDTRPLRVIGSSNEAHTVDA